MIVLEILLLLLVIVRKEARHFAEDDNCDAMPLNSLFFASVLSREIHQARQVYLLH